jgi:hypothetical protein
MVLALKREELVNRRDGYGVSGHVCGDSFFEVDALQLPLRRALA